MDTANSTVTFDYRFSPDGLYTCVGGDGMGLTQGRTYSPFHDGEGFLYLVDDDGDARYQPLALFTYQSHADAADQALAEAVAELNEQNYQDFTVTPDPGLGSEPDYIKQPVWYSDLEIEPIEFVMRNWPDAYRAHVIPYVSRAGKKLYPGKDAVASEIADLKKAARWLEMRIGQLEGNPCF